MRNTRIYIFFIGALASVFFVGGCSSGPGQADPKDAVISFFGAMEKNDQAALARLLDLAELMKNIDQDYAFQGDKARVFTNPKQILDDLTDDGFTKTRWFELQRIVNQVEIDGETAKVEVTFVDKKASQGFQTKFGLHMVNGKWKIYTFRAI